MLKIWHSKWQVIFFSNLIASNFSEIIFTRVLNQDQN